MPYLIFQGSQSAFDRSALSHMFEDIIHSRKDTFFTTTGPNTQNIAAPPRVPAGLLT